MPISDRSYRAGLRGTGALRHGGQLRGRARSLWMEARTVYEELGLRARRTAAPHRCRDRVAGGNPEEAVAILRWACDKLEELGVESIRATTSAFLADALRVRDFAEAKRFADVAAESGAHDDVVTQVMWRIARSKAEGDSQLAREHTPSRRRLTIRISRPRVHRARRTGRGTTALRGQGQRRRRRAAVGSPDRFVVGSAPTFEEVPEWQSTRSTRRAGTDRPGSGQCSPEGRGRRVGTVPGVRLLRAEEEPDSEVQGKACRQATREGQPYGRTAARSDVQRRLV